MEKLNSGLKLERMKTAFRIISLVFPPGWLALGAEGVAGGNFLAPVLAFLGLSLLGAWTLGLPGCCSPT